MINAQASKVTSFMTINRCFYTPESQVNHYSRITHWVIKCRKESFRSRNLNFHIVTKMRTAMSCHARHEREKERTARKIECNFSGVGCDFIVAMKKKTNIESVMKPCSEYLSHEKDYFLVFYHERSQVFIMSKRNCWRLTTVVKSCFAVNCFIEKFLFSLLIGVNDVQKPSATTVITIVDFNLSSNASFGDSKWFSCFLVWRRTFQHFHCLSFLKKGSDRLTRISANSLSYNLLWTATKTEKKLKTSSGRIFFSLFPVCCSFCFGMHTRN